MATHALYETSSGYAVFEVKLHDVVGALDKAVQASIEDYSKFSKMVSLVSFAPFQNAAHALENINDISESMSSHPYVFEGSSSSFLQTSSTPTSALYWS